MNFKSNNYRQSFSAKNNQNALERIFENFKTDNNTQNDIPTFSQQVLIYCKQKGINSGTDFSDATFLNRRIYSKLKKEIDYIPDERIAYTICIGLSLTFSQATYLLSLGGMSLMPRNENDGYRELLTLFLLTRYTFIPDCNDVLIKNGYDKLLGTIDRNTGNLSEYQ